MTGTGRSDHRGKKTENSIVNLEEPIKSISLLSHSSIFLAWSIYGLLKPETDNNNNKKNWFPISVKQERDWIRQEDNDLTSHGIRFDIETRKKKWRRMIAWKRSDPVSLLHVQPVSDRWPMPILKVTCFETHPFHRCSCLGFYERI